jgi:hypothetical protein
MNSMQATSAMAVALSLFIASAAQAQAEKPAEAKGGAPASVTVIAPVYGQLVRFSTPTAFAAVFENTKDTFYIREAVPKGETVNQWSQMITVTGAKGLASAPRFSTRTLAGAIAAGFKKACPDSFVTRDLGATKVGDRDAAVAVASCGKVNASADKHGETAMIIAVKGNSDAYTIQWAERASSASSGPAIDDAKWQGRLRELMPIRLCAIVPGEAAPFPSCLQQK